MKKCILFSRVSTVVQFYEEQYNFIIKEIEKVYTGRVKNGTYRVIVFFKNQMIKEQSFTIYTKRHKIEWNDKELDMKFVKRYTRK